MLTIHATPIPDCIKWVDYFCQIGINPYCSLLVSATYHEGEI